MITSSVTRKGLLKGAEIVRSMYARAQTHDIFACPFLNFVNALFDGKTVQNVQAI